VSRPPPGTTYRLAILPYPALLTSRFIVARVEIRHNRATAIPHSTHRLVAARLIRNLAASPLLDYLNDARLQPPSARTETF
jgi:hypothetical protein